MPTPSPAPVILPRGRLRRDVPSSATPTLSEDRGRIWLVHNCPPHVSPKMLLTECRSHREGGECGGRRGVRKARRERGAKPPTLTPCLSSALSHCHLPRFLPSSPGLRRHEIILLIPQEPGARSRQNRSPCAGLARGGTPRMVLGLVNEDCAGGRGQTNRD